MADDTEVSAPEERPELSEDEKFQLAMAIANAMRENEQDLADISGESDYPLAMTSDRSPVETTPVTATAPAATPPPPSPPAYRGYMGPMISDQEFQALPTNTITNRMPPPPPRPEMPYVSPEEQFLREARAKDRPGSYTLGVRMGSPKPTENDFEMVTRANEMRLRYESMQQYRDLLDSGMEPGQALARSGAQMFMPRSSHYNRPIYQGGQWWDMSTGRPRPIAGTAATKKPIFQGGKWWDISSGTPVPVPGAEITPPPQLRSYGRGGLGLYDPKKGTFTDVKPPPPTESKISSLDLMAYRDAMSTKRKNEDTLAVTPVDAPDRQRLLDGIEEAKQTIRRIEQNQKEGKGGSSKGKPTTKVIEEYRLKYGKDKKTVLARLREDGYDI